MEQCLQDKVIKFNNQAGSVYRDSWGSALSFLKADIEIGGFKLEEVALSEMVVGKNKNNKGSKRDNASGPKRAVTPCSIGSRKERTSTAAGESGRYG